jgi:TFIIF-interacting CTD phosphatase-like protein
VTKKTTNMGLSISSCCRKRAPKKPLLILDMNNVLVCRAFSPKLETEYLDLLPYIGVATLLGEHYTWKRPHLDRFLKRAFEHFTVAVWSSAMAKNVDLLCDFVFGERRQELLFEWDQSYCEVVPNDTPKPLYLKQLRKVWENFPEYNADNTFIIDDSVAKMQENPPHCVVLSNVWSPAAKQQGAHFLVQSDKLDDAVDKLVHVIEAF